MGENAARIDWAGVGVRVPWRLVGPRTVRWAVERALEGGERRRRAGDLAAWALRHDGAARAADRMEVLAALAPR